MTYEERLEISKLAGLVRMRGGVKLPPISKRKWHWAKKTVYEHKKRGKNVQVTTLEMFELAEKTDECPLCGYKIGWLDMSVLANQPTMDAIDPALPFAPDNVQILCFACNTGKGSQSMPEYLDRCRAIAARNP